MRTSAGVPDRSLPVKATIEKGADWLISRTVSPPPTPVNGCWVRTVSSALGPWCRPGRTAANGTITTVAAMAVNRIAGAGRRRDDTVRCYVWASCYQGFDTG